MTTDEVLAIARGGRGGRLPRGALHARRQARAALPRRARGARPRWASRRPRRTWRTAPGGAARDGAAAAREPRHPRRRRAARAARGLRRRRGSCSRRRARGCRSAARPHFGSPDKLPDVRLDAIDRAGRLAIPYTSGILIGIGETRRERVEALLALRDLHERHGHLQEVIVQNFRAKAGTKMAEAPEPSLDDHLWTIAVARLLMPLDVAVQAPPNLAHAEFPRLLEAGINDWGGVSPVTPDHVNPEAPWPERRAARAQAAAAAGPHARAAARDLPALPARPRALARRRRVRGAALAASDARRPGARRGTWFAGDESGSRRRPGSAAGARTRRARSRRRSPRRSIAANAAPSSARPTPRRCCRPAAPRSSCWPRAADARRAERYGDEVTYVVCRNINYTNVCYFRCGFCAFSKGTPGGEPARARLPARASTRSCAAAPRPGSAAPPRSACRAASIPASPAAGTSSSSRRSAPSCRTCTSTRSRRSRSGRARRPRAGRCATTSSSCATPGSAGCRAPRPRSSTTRCAACSAPTSCAPSSGSRSCAPRTRVGLRTTSTIMFGHIEAPVHQARHLLALRDLQRDTGGFTEFVPLPFVHEEAPIALKGLARRGPTFREAVVLHAAARLVLDPYITSIQASWVKLGPDGARALPARRRERPRRHAHERVDQPRRRRQPRPGVPARADGGSDPRRGPRARASAPRCTATRPPSAVAASLRRRARSRRPIRRPTTTVGCSVQPT